MDIVTSNGMAYGPTTTITPTGSPFTWVNTEATRVMVYVSAGTVTDVSCAPDALNFIAAGLLGGQYGLNPGQAIKVVYLIAPTMKYHPV